MSCRTTVAHWTMRFLARRLRVLLNACVRVRHPWDRRRHILTPHPLFGDDERLLSGTRHPRDLPFKDKNEAAEEVRGERRLSLCVISIICSLQHRHVVLKIVKSASRYTETALDEIKLLQRPITSSTPPRLPTPQRHPSLPPPRAHPHESLAHLKPENVLISIDDVEAVISAEMASSLAQPLSPLANADPADPSKVCSLLSSLLPSSSLSTLRPSPFVLRLSFLGSTSGFDDLSFFRSSPKTFPSFVHPPRPFLRRTLRPITFLMQERERRLC
ncbi:hypothetical protein NMY22_g11112 [Coprinellus aureogranulatus]|nr:hypothetical protein NMY22_g11112 [Coprinellus aureogranulatus]